MESVTIFQILDKAICVLLHVNALEKSMNEYVFLLAMGKH